MNMHCLVAVARCRVQTRRYHCLINHIQSHRAHPVCPPLSPFSPCSIRSPLSPLSSPRSRRGPAVSSLRALRAFSLIVLSHSLSSPRSSPRSTLPLFPSRQLAAIDINLRNFFGASTCHRVIAHPRPGVSDAGAECHPSPLRGDAVRGCNGGKGSERKGANEDKRGRSVESPNGHPWSPRGDIRNVNRTNQSGTSWPRN